MKRTRVKHAGRGAKSHLQDRKPKPISRVLTVPDRSKTGRHQHDRKRDAVVQTTFYVQGQVSGSNSHYGLRPLPACPAGAAVWGKTRAFSPKLVHPRSRRAAGQAQGLPRYPTCLVESCGVIGGPQVRNVATLAGNIAHALPAGDGTIGLLALGGEVEVASTKGTHWQPMGETFLGPGESTVDATRMMISRMRFPPTGKNEGSVFQRVMRPQGVALPMISMAARVKLSGERIENARISIGPAGRIPFLAEQTGEFLAGDIASDTVLQEVATVAEQEASFRNSKHRATAEYRAEMIRALLPKVLARAIERAQSSHAEPAGVGL